MHFKMLSAICFNLDLSKILLSGNGLTKSVFKQARDPNRAERIIVNHPKKEKFRSKTRFESYAVFICTICRNY